MLLQHSYHSFKSCCVRRFLTLVAAVWQLNDRLSLGQHRVWKQTTVKVCGAKRGDQVLDVCCGSGDLAFRLARAVGLTGKASHCCPAGLFRYRNLFQSFILECAWQVYGLDFSSEMLEDAERRQKQLRFPASRGSGLYTIIFLFFSHIVCDAATNLNAGRLWSGF